MSGRPSSRREAAAGSSKVKTNSILQTLQAATIIDTKPVLPAGMKLFCSVLKDLPGPWVPANNACLQKSWP